MTAPTFTLHESAKNPHADIWFADPPGFTALPLEALLAPPGSPPAVELQAAFAPFLAAAPDELSRQQFIGQVASGQQLLAALREVGTVYCSIGLHRDDTEGGDGRTLLSLFTLGWQDTATAPRAITAARAVATADNRHTHIEFLELPCGPATLSETLRSPAADSGLPQQPLLQIHAHLPAPDGKRLAVLTLSTTAVAHREAYRGILRQIAELVSFDDPLGAVEEGDPSVPLR